MIGEGGWSAPNLSGKTALVTGAARGLGLAMARGLAEAGANVVIADIDADSLLRVARLESFDLERTLVCEVDIGNYSSCQAAVQACTVRFGTLDILVNNAGRGPNYVLGGPSTRSLKFWEADPQRWANVILTNAVGTYFMSHVAAPAMIERRFGRIINVTTSLATMYRREGSPYGVSKAAIDTETLIWARDLAGTGVTVNTLVPGGAVDTDFVSPSTREAAANGRATLLDPKVMVSPVLWLASDGSSGWSGARIVAAKWDVSLRAEEALLRALEAPILRGAEALAPGEKQ